MSDWEIGDECPYCGNDQMMGIESQGISFRAQDGQVLGVKAEEHLGIYTVWCDSEDCGQMLMEENEVVVDE